MKILGTEGVYNERNLFTPVRQPEPESQPPPPDFESLFSIDKVIGQLPDLEERLIDLIA